MAHTTPCDQCAQTGLPILFTRYAAAYSATSEGKAALDALKPDGKLQAEPNQVALKTARYNLRMLRGGYLYLRMESVFRTPEWLAFAVHPHGYLTRIDINHPKQTAAGVACKPNEWGANRSLVWIKDAENITKLQFMFHPDPIDPDHLKTVIGKEPDKYMQTFKVSAWVKGATAQDDTLQPDQLDAKVLEFKALSGTALQDLASEQVFGLMGCSPGERQWGDWEEEVVTRMPLIFDDAGRTEEFTEIVKHPQPGYSQVHGPRLLKMIEFLKAGEGAVVACEDPIGIAQELSMHHLTAAVPYVRWLHETDAKGVSNQFKQAASASISTIRQGLRKAVMSMYDRQTEMFRRSAEAYLEPYPGAMGTGTVKVRQPDGSFRDVSIAELNRQRSAEALQKADQRDRERAAHDKGAGEKAAAKISALCDNAALEAFDTLHRGKIKARDDLMDSISADLQHWLAADGFIEKALGRYNQNADPTRSADGLYCAGQLCAILLQMDSAPKGRQWYAALDIFSPGPKNLVWRMLSFNNKTLSAELEQALKLATDPLIYGEQKVKDAQRDTKQQQAITLAAGVLGNLSKLLKSADTIGKADLKLSDPLTRDWMARASAYWDIGKAAKDNMASVLLVSTLASAQKLRASALETHIARGQVLLMAHGMGSASLGFVKSDLTTAIQDKRVPVVLGGLSMLSIIPKLGTAAVKQDARSLTGASASIADAIGMVKGWRADFYNETVLKQVPNRVPVDQLAGKLREATQELKRLKAGAAVFVVAGSAVGVWWDVVDAHTAYKEKDLLWVAYVVRVTSGVGTIGGAIAGVFAGEAAIALVKRINVYLAVATAAATVAIGKLQGEAWVNWLLAQPFRVDKVRDADKNAFMAGIEDKVNAAMPTVKDALGHLGSMAAGMNGVAVPPPAKPAPSYPASAPESQVPKANRKTPFKSEAEMMGKLSDALSAVK